MKINNFYKDFFFGFILFFLLGFIACGRLSEKTAKESFLKENPSYTIISSSTGEGWDGVAYHQFAYKKPYGDKIYREIWCFVQQKDGTWEVTNREILNE